MDKMNITHHGKSVCMVFPLLLVCIRNLTSLLPHSLIINTTNLCMLLYHTDLLEVFYVYCKCIPHR